ncbi:MAG: Maf and M48 domain-containing protein [Candidatus Omnitrophica bacterium]|nr:Maf and M48 domain-containing protein [Candidatus Omnitrophota bacterium]
MKQKPIYLASDSKARRKLLRLFGLKFSVIPSRIKEDDFIEGMSFAQLVKRNARRKAEAVAARLKKGIVIAADTIVVQGKKVFGKPKDLASASKMLKYLSGKTQWIYSGLCVIDVEKKITKLAVEKTKIYMDHLQDKEIKGYFRCVNPLDKAGSFDIQGKGGFFIRRIDGCFYNVVGLPVRRLYRMLKEIGVRIFSFSIFCILSLVSGLFSGCSTEYNVVTGQQEVFYYSTEREIALGQAMAKEIEKQYKPVSDPLIQEKVASIGKQIATVSDRKDVNYEFKVLEENEVNAVALPGGYVYVFKGLVEKISNDDELAAVLAHEVGHIVARHSIKRLQAIMGYSLMRLLSIPLSENSEVLATSDAAFTTLLLGYSREDELLADQLGARYAKLAGYNPRGMISFLEKLQEDNRRKPPRPKNYLKTHPFTADRIRVVKQELGESLSFTDYINVEDRPYEKKAR